jgi:hypothetical protein
MVVDVLTELMVDNIDQSDNAIGSSLSYAYHLSLLLTLHAATSHHDSSNLPWQITPFS